MSVSNHSRLEDVELEVREHLVLVGPNDVGKSSLLRCLDLLLGSTTASLYARISESDFRDPSRPFVVEATFTELSEVDETPFPDEVRVASDGGAASLRLRLHAELDQASGTMAIQRTAPDANNRRQLSREQVEAVGWKMVGAISSGLRDMRDEGNSSLDDILAAVDLGPETTGFQQVVQDFQQRLTDSQALGTLRTQLAAQLSRALPEAVEAGHLSFQTAAASSDDIFSDVRLQVHKDGQPRNLTEQSDGARALFAIALYDLVSAAANVVAIDEPEIHLHPSSQRSLARLLQNSTTQKVLATHSPDIVSAFGPDCVVSVRPGGRLIQPPAGLLSADPKQLVQWWGRDALEPLTARRILAVEGRSDRLIVQRVASLMDMELDRLGISVVELNGCGGLRFVQQLFGSQGFGIDLSVLIDSDAVERAVEDMDLSGREDLESRSVFVAQADLEDEYVAALGADAMYAALADSTLFKPGQVRRCQGTGEGGRLTDSDVAVFCRSKQNKVRAALVAASALTRDNAPQVNSVHQLLQSIAGQ